MQIDNLHSFVNEWNFENMALWLTSESICSFFLVLSIFETILNCDLHTRVSDSVLNVKLPFPVQLKI